MRSVRRALFLALLAVFVPVGSVLAHFTEWPSWSEATALYTNYTTFVNNDSVRASIYAMYWDSTRRANMLHQAQSHGLRFTADVQDISGHLSAANRFDTNLPAPYFDRDMGSYRCHEAEITADSSSFPAASSYYSAGFYFTHFWKAGGWVWDSNGGSLSYAEQLSMYTWWLDDVWNTASPIYGAGATAELGTRAYPALGFPGSWPPPGSQPCNSDGGPLAPIGQAASQAVSGTTARAPAAEWMEAFDVFQAGDEVGEVVVRPDWTGGVQVYAAKAHALTRALLSNGPVEATVTFSRPLAEADVRRLSDLGLTILSVEAVASPDQQGLHWTFGDDYSPAAFEFFASAARENGVDLLGTVSAHAVIPDMETFNRLVRDSAVFLVDGSAEQVRRSSPIATDVHLNDVYWQLAGWEN
jgi:hypothetical protein